MSRWAFGGTVTTGCNSSRGVAATTLELIHRGDEPAHALVPPGRSSLASSSSAKTRCSDS